jgi:hypothetical protein
VEAGLLELLFDIDLALLHEREKIAAHPGDLGEGEAVLRDIDGLPGEVRGCGVTFGRRGVAVDVHQVLLELDGADRGVDLQIGVEVGVVRAGQRGEELRGPRAAIATVGWQTLVDFEGTADWNGNQKPLVTHVEEGVVVLDAVQAVVVSHKILVDEDLVGAFESRRNDETAPLVIERGQDDGGRGCIFDTLELRPFGSGADDADGGNRTIRSAARGCTGLPSGFVEFVRLRGSVDRNGGRDRAGNGRRLRGGFQEVGGGGDSSGCSRGRSRFHGLHNFAACPGGVAAALGSCWPLCVDAGEHGPGCGAASGGVSFTDASHWFSLDVSVRVAAGTGDRGPVALLGEAVRRFGEEGGRQKKQDSKRQKGRYGGVQTHHEI